MYFRSDGWVKSPLGQAIAGASVYLCNQPADVSFIPPMPEVQLYADPLGATPIAQPVITDGFGHYDFYVPYGTYTLVVVNGGNIQQVYTDQTIGFSTSGGAVDTVFGRTGNVLAQFSDYSAFYDPLGAAAAAVVGLAPLANPNFTGTVQIVNAVITGTLRDGGGSVGTSGQLLSSTGTGTAWVTGGGGGSGTVASGTKSQIGIYASTGNTISGFNNAIFYPETYGAAGDGITDDTVAIQNTINAVQSNGGGTVKFGPKTYLTTATLAITSSNVCLEGTTQGSSVIKCTSASADILTLTGTGAFISGTNLYYNRLSFIRLLRSVNPTGTAAGVRLTLVNGLRSYGVESIDNVYCFYHTGCSFIEYTQCQATFTSTTTTATVYGWYQDGGNNGNYSGRNLDSAVVNAGSTATAIYGMYLTGNYVADQYCEGFETELCHYGMYVNALTSGTGFGISNYQNDNLHFVRCIHDNCKISAYVINNLYGYNSYCEILGGYVAPFTGASTPLIDIENSAGVLLTSIQVRAGGNGTATNPGVYINGTHSTNNVINGCSFYVQDAGTPIVLNSCSNNAVVNNTIYGYSGAPFAIGIKLTGASSNTIDGNNLSGTGTTGISLDATSNDNGGVNVVDPTSITTPLSDSGTGNFVTLSGSGGSGDFVKLAEVIVSSGVPTVNFSSISASYRNLKLVVTGRTVGAADLYLQFNGDTGANYNYYLMYNGSGTATNDTFGATSLHAGQLALGGGPANQAGSSEIMIYDYARTAWNKNVTSQATKIDVASTTAYIIAFGGTWNSTAAINAILVGTSDGSNFAVDTVLTLYGLK